MSTKSWQDVLLEVVEADPADFTDRKNICISPKDLGEILRAALAERDAEISGWKADQKENLQIQVDQHQVIAAQRRVLEQALEALKRIIANLTEGDFISETRLDEGKAAITAIQEVLS